MSNHEVIRQSELFIMIKNSNFSNQFILEVLIHYYQKIKIDLISIIDYQ